MKTAKDFRENTRPAILVIGPPLSGKTNLAMHFPRPYFLSTDGKLGNAMQNHPDKEFFYDLVNYTDGPNNTLVEVPPAQRWKRLTTLFKSAAANPEIDTIVFDNLTDMNEDLQQHIIAQGSGKLTVAGIKVMEQNFWQAYKMLMRSLIVTAKATGKYVLMLAHMDMQKDELSGTITEVPFIQGSLRAGLGALFTDVWRTEAKVSGKGVSYNVLTAPTYRAALGTSIGMPTGEPFKWATFEECMKKAGYVV